MNTLTLSHAQADPRPGRALGLLLVAEGLLALAPGAVLGAAIGWPASLGRPAAEQLAAIAAKPDAVALGYGIYLLYSVLIAPLMIGLAARTFGTLNSVPALSVAVFGALSALARAVGILRWLTVMPALASAHAGADPAARAAIEALFMAVHSYGGGIGEVLGVSLFMALALGTLGICAPRAGGLPRPLALAALPVALLLGALALPALGLDVRVPVAAAVSLLSLWMLAVGVWLLRAKRG